MIFDQKATQFPIPAAAYWATSSQDGDRRIQPQGTGFQVAWDTNAFGLTYYVVRCGARTKIVYWSCYLGQQRCAALNPDLFSDGAHEGDWEHIVVETTADLKDIYRVTIAQHGGWYTRYPGGFQTF